MKRPKSRGGKHRVQSPARASTAILTAAAIISIIILAALVIWAICASHRLCGGKAQVASPAPPLGGRTERQEVNVTFSKPSNSTTHILHDEPLEGGGEARSQQGLEAHQDSMESGQATPSAPQQRDRPAIEVMQNAVVEAQAARERAGKIAAITSYMVQYHGAPGLIALAPLIVDTAEVTGMDCRMAPCTAAAESTCGSDPKANGNLFGCLGGNSNSWPAQITWYFGHIADLNAQHGWNSNWEIAYFWYGGGSPYGADGTGTSAGYADNVIRDLDGIGW